MAVGLGDPPPLAPVAGIRLAAATAGIYRNPRPDLCLVSIAPGSTAAAMFTRNAFAAAPVSVARTHLDRAAPRYCLINAGNANAGTGSRGLENARSTCRLVAETAGCRIEEVFPMSTGVIGEHLPVDAVRNAIPGLHRSLREDGWLECARAIMTTDTVAKGSSRQYESGGASITVTGIAKGSGMIHPRMGTMLAFVATDAAIGAELAGDMLRRAAGSSFNRISVDGDTSTNDTILLAATGGSGGAAITDPGSADAVRFQDALEAVCGELARAIVRDGEGATKFITIRVEGGHSEAECLQVADTVASSPLVKTAFFASDPNWGRILAAVGRSGVPELDIDGVSVLLDDVCIFDRGMRAAAYREEDGRRVMSRPEITISIRLGRGTESVTAWTCDLSYDYVRINAEYRT